MTSIGVRIVRDRASAVRSCRPQSHRFSLLEPPEARSVPGPSAAAGVRDGRLHDARLTAAAALLILGPRPRRGGHHGNPQPVPGQTEVDERPDPRGSGLIVRAGQAGGGYEIRTREGFIPTRFPSVRPRPLGESSVGQNTGPPGRVAREGRAAPPVGQVLCSQPLVRRHLVNLPRAGRQQG